LPLKVTRKRVERSGVAARPASKFCALAAIIYGETNADLYERCREVKAALDRNAV
jgi:hypothetical protein